MIDGKAKHSPTNDWDTNAVWVDASTGGHAASSFRAGAALVETRRCSILDDSATQRSQHKGVLASERTRAIRKGV